MALYFIRSVAKGNHYHNGSVERTEPVTSHSEYKDFVSGWIDKVAETINCEKSDVIITSVSRLD